MKIRIGFGEDIHRLVSGRKLFLCGIPVPFDLGLLGHSDGDVALHALSDALLGAAALGDIGKYFPPSDPSTEGISSALIVKKCLSLVESKGYKVGNVDINIVTEEPHLQPFIGKMRESVAMMLGVDIDSVSVKAMTNEGLDAVGKETAIRATAALTLIGE